MLDVEVVLMSLLLTLNRFYTLLCLQCHSDQINEIWKMLEGCFSSIEVLAQSSHKISVPSIAPDVNQMNSLTLSKRFSKGFAG